MRYVEIYNFESGAPAYRRHDLVSGAVETNLPGMADLAKQSTEVADVLKTLYAAYCGDAATGRCSANSVHFNVDGAVKTFALKTRNGRISVPFVATNLHGRGLNSHTRLPKGHGRPETARGLPTSPVRHPPDRLRQSARGQECPVMADEGARAVDPSLHREPCFRWRYGPKWLSTVFSDPVGLPNRVGLPPT